MVAHINLPILHSLRGSLIAGAWEEAFPFSQVPTYLPASEGN